MNTYQYRGLAAGRQVYKSLRLETVTNPRPYRDTKSWKRALTLRRFQAVGEKYKSPHELR